VIDLIEVPERSPRTGKEGILVILPAPEFIEILPLKVGVSLSDCTKLISD
jgi:hypothetical protein